MADPRPGIPALTFAALVQHSHDIITVLDAAGYITFDNPAVEQLLGYASGARVGRIGGEFVHPEDLERVRAVMRRVREEPGGTGPQIEFRLRHAAGHWVWVEGIGVNRLDDPAVRGLVITKRDITDRQRASAMIRLLADVGHVLTDARDIDATLTRIARLVSRELAETCLIDLLTPEGTIRHAAAAHADPAIEQQLRDMLRDFPTPLESGTLLAAALRTGRVQVLDEPVDEWQRRVSRSPGHHAVLQSLRVGTYVVVPLTIRGESVGAIRFSSPEPGRFADPTALALAEELGRRVAAAIETARLQAALERRVAALTTIGEVARVINSAVRLADVLNAIVQHVHGAFGYRLVSIYLLRDEVLEIQAQIGYQEVLERIPLGYAVNGRVARTGDPTFVRQAAGDPDFVAVKPEANQGIFIPLKADDGRVLGTLSVESTGEPPLTDDDFALLQLVADQASVAVAKARLFAELELSEQRFRDIALASGGYIWEQDAAGQFTYLSERAAQLFRRPVDELIGHSPLDFVPDEDRERIADAYRATAIGAGALVDLEHEVVTPAGRVWQSVSGVRRVGSLGETVGLRGAATDITERKLTEAALRRSALFDALTDLPNRTLLYERLQQGIRLARRQNQPFALLMMDLDHFKEVNDSFGHHYGDLLLRQIGPRLRGALRDSDTIARLGGDEFAALLPDVGGPDAVTVARKLLVALEPPFVVDGPHASPSLSIGASIGVAVFPDHGSDAETLMRRADIAMYVAKRSRAGAALFEPDLEQPTVSRVSLLGEVRSAIEGGHLDLHFQPQVQMPAGQLARAEALVRWRHPQRGLILPGEFIPLVEQSGLMNQLTARVLRDALAYYQQWRAVGLRIPLTVNLSARNLNDPRLADTLAALLREYNVTPMDLTLDISEASLLSEATRALDLLHHVRSLGVRVAVDDFGGNVPALPLLRRLPVDEVKLDHSVVRSMDLAGSTLQDAIAVGHAMGLVVSAEGVEEPRTWRRLSELNCDMAQGYLVSYPLPAANLVEWVRGRQRGWGNELIAYPRK